MSVDDRSSQRRHAAAAPAPLTLRPDAAAATARAGTPSCDACPDATFFHRAGWQRVIEQSFGQKTWFYYVEQDGQIQGVLPLAKSTAGCSATALGAMHVLRLRRRRRADRRGRARCSTTPPTSWRAS